MASTPALPRRPNRRTATPPVLGKSTLRPVLRASLIVAFSLIAAASTASAQSGTRSDLETRLEEALAGVGNVRSDGLELVQELDTFIATSPEASDELRFKTRLLEAIVNLRRDELTLSRKQVVSTLADLDPSAFPVLTFRFRSLHAALMHLAGDWIESERAFEALLADDLSQIDDELVDRARTNHAVVLNDVGRVGAAADLYERLMVDALEAGRDQTAIHAGNNLISLLLDQGDRTAAAWPLEQLRPLIASKPENIGSRSLQLHELELRILDGQAASTLEVLQASLNSETSPLLLGSTHRLLAQALLRLDRLDEALFHAKKANALFENRASELIDARMVEASVLIEKKRFAQAQEILEQVAGAAEAVPARAVTLHRLRMKAGLLQSGRAEDASNLDALIAAEERNDRRISKTRSDYFEARLSAVRQGLALRRAQELAFSRGQSARAERRLRQFTMIAAGIATLGVCFAVFAFFRSKERRFRAKQQERQNEILRAQVQERTEELKASLEAKSQMEKALQTKRHAEAIGKLAGNIAHDVNNLLQVIANANSVLNDNPEDREALEVSQQSVTHGAELVQRLLAYTQKASLAPRTIDFSAYLQEQAGLFRSAVGSRVTLDVDDQSRGARIHADVAQLTTTILNLLTNAADASNGEGRVLIESSKISLPNEEHGWQNIDPGDYLRLRIVDEGEGMSPHALARSVDPFFTTKSPEVGTGLGLSSAQGFVQQSGGDLVIRSQLEKGTEVELVLPLSARHLPREPSKTKSAEQSCTPKRVLVVDDHPAVLRTLTKLLRRLRLNVVSVSSGEDATELLSKDPAFDLVLTDVKMPGGMDGFDLARWTHDSVPLAKVVLMSGYNDLPRQDIQLPLLTKPFDLSELERILAEI